MEKKFRDLANSKENSHSNVPRPPPHLQPPVHSKADLQPAGMSSLGPRSQQYEYGVSNSQTSLEASPPIIYDHHTDTQQSTHQHTHSIFSNQLCEGENAFSLHSLFSVSPSSSDEFDSLMGDIAGEIDF